MRDDTKPRLDAAEATDRRSEAIRFIFIQVYRRDEDDALLHQNLRVIPDEIAVSKPLTPGQLESGRC